MSSPLRITACNGGGADGHDCAGQTHEAQRLPGEG